MLVSRKVYERQTAACNNSISSCLLLDSSCWFHALAEEPHKKKAEVIRVFAGPYLRNEFTLSGAKNDCCRCKLSGSCFSCAAQATRHSLQNPATQLGLADFASDSDSASDGGFASKHPIKGPALDDRIAAAARQRLATQQFSSSQAPTGATFNEATGTWVSALDAKTLADFASSDSDSDSDFGAVPAASGGQPAANSTGGSSVSVHGAAPTEGAALQAALASMADSDSDSSSGEDWDAAAVAQAGAAAAQQARARGVKGPINLTMGNVQLPASPSKAGSPPSPSAHTPSSDWDRESTVGSAAGTPKADAHGSDKGRGLEQFLSDSDSDDVPQGSPGSSSVPPAVAAAIRARTQAASAAGTTASASTTANRAQGKPWMQSLQKLVPPAPPAPGRQLPQASPLKTAASPLTGGAVHSKPPSPEVTAAATAELRQYTERLLKGGPGAGSGAFAAAQQDVMSDPAWRRLLELAAAGAAGGGGRSGRAFAVRATGLGGEGISIVTGRGAASAEGGGGSGYIIEGGRGGSQGSGQASGAMRRLGQSSAFQRARSSRQSPPKAAAPVVQGGAFSRLYQRQSAAHGGGTGAGNGAHSAYAAARAAKANNESIRRAAAGAGGRRSHDAATRRAAVREVLGGGERTAEGGARRRSPAAQRAGYGTWGGGSSGRPAAPFGSATPRLAGDTPPKDARVGGHAHHHTHESHRTPPADRPQSSRAAAPTAASPAALPPARRGSFSADGSKLTQAPAAAAPPQPPPGISTAPRKASDTAAPAAGPQLGLPFHSKAEHTALLGAKLAADAAHVRALEERVKHLEHELEQARRR